MALVLDVTVGGAASNSYCTKAEADTIGESVFPASTIVEWDGALATDQLRALVAAAARLDEEHFVGGRADGVQALAWPRAGVHKPGQYSLYLATEIPYPVKMAQARLAFFLLDQTEAQGNASPLSVAKQSGVSSVSIPDGPSITFEGGASSVSALDRFMVRVIRPILAGLVYAPSARAVRG